MDRFHALLRFVLFLLIVALVVAVGVGVFWRYVLGESLYWSTEVPNFLFVWIVFLGAVVAYREKKHIAFTALLEKMSAGGRKAPEIAVHLVVLGFAVFLIVTGTMVVRQTMSSPSEALKMPLGYLYAVLPVTMLLVALDAVAEIVNVLRRQAGKAVAP